MKKVKRVWIPSHSEVKVEFILTTDDLKFYRIDNQYGYEYGEFEIMIGKNSNEYLIDNFNLVENS